MIKNSKKTPTKRPTISKTRLAKFLAAFRRSRKTWLGLPFTDNEPWYLEENEDYRGEYFVNYWAKSRGTYWHFKTNLASAAQATGLEFDIIAKFGELAPEEDGEHKGLTLTCFSLDADGSRAYYKAEYKRLNAGK